MGTHLSNLVGSPVLTEHDVRELNAYHCPKGKDINFMAVRDACENLMNIIIKYSPCCADRTKALQHVRSARMWANSAIALEGVGE